MTVSVGQGRALNIPFRALRGEWPESGILKSTLYLPCGAGPHPVVVFCHGSTGPGYLLLSDVERPHSFAALLNQMGVALIAPMRRGRGGSDGIYMEGYFADLDGSRRGLEYAAHSVDATLRFVANEAWADRSRVVLAGQSRGGLLALWVAAMRPCSCVGALSFSAGWNGSREAHEGDDVNTHLLAEITAKLDVAALALYGTEDRYYSSSATENYINALRQAPQELMDTRLLQTPQGDGHRLFHAYIDLWRNPVENFMARVMRL